MAHDTHDVGLTALGINGIAHGLAVDGEAFVGLTIDFIPALQCLVEVERVDADQDIAEDGLTRYEVGTLSASAAETLSCLGAETLCPV